MEKALLDKVSYLVFCIYNVISLKKLYYTAGLWLSVLFMSKNNAWE